MSLRIVYLGILFDHTSMRSKDGLCVLFSGGANEEEKNVLIQAIRLWCEFHKRVMFPAGSLLLELEMIAPLSCWKNST